MWNVSSNVRRRTRGRQSYRYIIFVMSPACLRKEKEIILIIIHHTYRSQVVEIITIYVHATIQSVTVKEEVDLQPWSLRLDDEQTCVFVSSSRSFKKETEKKRKENDLVPLSISERISASRTFEFWPVYATIFITIFFIRLSCEIFFRNIFCNQRSSSDLPHLKQQVAKSEIKRKREKKKRIAAILNIFS